MSDELEAQTDSAASSTAPIPLTAPVPIADEPPSEAKPDHDEALDRLTEAVQELRADFQRSAALDDHNRALIDKLHTENEQLRRAELERARDPVIRDLISLVDTCLRNGRAWLERDAVTPADIERVLRDVTDDVELILERQGVETFEPEIGTKFDRRVARAVRATGTADPAQDGMVTTVLKPGYRLGDRILRYCEVVVWAFTASPAPAPPDTDSSAPAVPEQ